MNEQSTPMTITILGTTVNITGDRIIGFALNNLVNTFIATTDLTNEWTYQLYVHMLVPDLYNIINLNWQEGTQDIYVDLTADMLPYSGRYEMQFVATNGEQVSHTDIFEVYVKNSLDVSQQYTPVPSEFYQIQKEIQQNVQISSNNANEALNSANLAQNAQQAIENMTVTASTLTSTSNASVTKTTEQGVVNLEFGIPQGLPGTNGGYYSPSVSSTGELTWLPSVSTMPSIPSSNIMGPSYILTEQDKQEITQEVINSLPVYNGEVQDIV